jgi:hypothetical protein
VDGFLLLPFFLSFFVVAVAVVVFLSDFNHYYVFGWGCDRDVITFIGFLFFCFYLLLRTGLFTAWMDGTGGNWVGTGLSGYTLGGSGLAYKGTAASG